MFGIQEEIRACRQQLFHGAPPLKRFGAIDWDKPLHGIVIFSAQNDFYRIRLLVAHDIV